MDSLHSLFALAEAYGSHLGLAEGTVSARVLGGGNRLRDLRAKKSDIGFFRVQAAIRWFSENWPEGLDWPKDVVRPEEPATGDADPAPAPEAA